jgi:hypothetical protein
VHLVKNGVKKAYRRILSTNEIANFENYLNIFRWDPNADLQIASPENSVLLSSVSKRLGVTTQDLLEEMKRRSNVLHWMRQQKIRSYKEVASIIAEYYARPKEFYQKIRANEEVKIVAASREV